MYNTYWTSASLKGRAVCLCCSVLPSVCRFFGFAQTWFRFEFVVSAIWDRSIGGEGPPVPSLLLLSMAFGTYFIWMSGTFKWPIMDILWILWTIQAVIAIEGKLVFSSHRVKPHPLDQHRLWVWNKARTLTISFSDCISILSPPYILIFVVLRLRHLIVAKSPLVLMDDRGTQKHMLPHLAGALRMLSSP